MLNAKISEIVKVVDVIGPIDPTNAADEYNGRWLDLSLYDSIMFVISVGDVAATLTAAVYETTNVNTDDSPDGDGAAVTGKSVEFSGSDDNEQKIINISARDFDGDDGLRQVRLQVTNVDSPPGVLGFHAIALATRRHTEQAGHASSVTEVKI
jgi:hypothetical protein